MQAVHAPGLPIRLGVLGSIGRAALARPALFVVLVALPLLLVRLGAKDVWEASEGRPLQSAREMRAQGDWLVQYTNGEVDLTKPPLYAWLTAASFRLAGEESEFAGRLPSVLATLGVLAGVVALGRRAGGARTGLLAGLFLLTSIKFLWQARLAELETLLALGVVTATVAFHAALDDGPGRRRTLRFLAFHAAWGFAFAVKGPIALLLVAPGCLAGALARGRARALRSTAFLATFPAFLVVGLSWYLAVVLRDPASLPTFLSYAQGENVGHLRDPFYYLAQYPLYALPWTPLVILGLVRALRRRTDADAPRAGVRPFAWTFVVTFLLQSALQAKQTHYLVPVVFPMGAILAASYVDARLAARPASAPAGPAARAPRLLAAILTLTVLAEGVVAAVVVPRWNADHSARAFFARVAAEVPKGTRLGWTIFGSHSDYLWYLPMDLVGRRGLRELNRGPGTLDALRAQLGDGSLRYALLRGEEADRLEDVAEVLVRDDAFQRKDRRVALVRAKGAR